jgi:hypothetical protein
MGMEELYSLYRSLNTVRVITSRVLRRAGHVARMGEVTSVLKISTSKPAGKRPLGRPKGRWAIQKSLSSAKLIHFFNNHSYIFLPPMPTPS